jgi:hypothetical protein
VNSIFASDAGKPAVHYSRRQNDTILEWNESDATMARSDEWISGARLRFQWFLPASEQWILLKTVVRPSSISRTLAIRRCASMEVAPAQAQGVGCHVSRETFAERKIR